jgi:chromosome partitioning protein
MPVITLSSPKGGAGKTTAATVLATELAERGARVTIIDADPNKNVVDWSKLPGLPPNITVIGDVTEETIVDLIEEAASKTPFVVVDLEGTASLMVSYAISMSDFVLIPVQGSQLDAKQAARQMKLIKAQERIAGRAIPYAVLFTRSNPAIQPKTQRHIEERFVELEVPVLSTRLYDREPFRALFSFGGSLSSLKDKGMNNLPAALTNAREFTVEVIERLRNGNQPVIKEVA